MKQKIKLFIHAAKESYETTYRFVTFPSDYSNYGYVLLGVKDITVEVPDIKDIILLHVKNLEAKKAKVLADAMMNSNRLDDEIQKLLCLEHKDLEAPE